MWSLCGMHGSCHLADGVAGVRPWRTITALSASASGGPSLSGVEDCGEFMEVLVAEHTFRGGGQPSVLCRLRVVEKWT
jgi:hypothetical protein